MTDISVSGKQTKIGNALTLHSKKNLLNSLNKYFSTIVSANILFSKDTFNFKCEININVEHNIFVKGHGLSNDAYGAFNIANEKIKKRLRRYHRKLTDHRKKPKKSSFLNKTNQYIIKNPNIAKMNEEIDNPLIIAETHYEIETLSVSEALMIMELNEQNAILFKNSSNKKLNFLSKRSDGNIEWVDTEKKNK
tara:strand:+ start:1105 stop:1683 length:579 start_codon:yes stop_codon:yes gene_type:complete